LKLVIAPTTRAFLSKKRSAHLAQSGLEVLDLGAFKIEPQDDYPDFAERLGLAIKQGDAPPASSSAVQAWASVSRQQDSGIAPACATIPTPPTRASSTTHERDRPRRAHHRILISIRSRRCVIKAQFIVTEERFRRRFKKSWPSKQSTCAETLHKKPLSTSVVNRNFGGAGVSTPEREQNSAAFSRAVENSPGPGRDGGSANPA